MLMQGFVIGLCLSVLTNHQPTFT